MLHCPNCGLENPDGAKFCSNCGTPFGSAGSLGFTPPPSQPPYPPPPPPYQQPEPYQAAPAVTSGNSLAKNIGIGCLIFIAIMLFLGLSCTRACFGLRHRSYIHRYY